MALSPDFEGVNKTNVIQVLILGFGGCWRLLTGVWHLDLDLDMVTGNWYTPGLDFGSLSWFWRCKEHPCPLSPHFGLWRTLEVPDWGLAFWFWFGYGPGSWIWLWFLVWAMAFGFGFDLFSVESRQYVVSGFGFRVWLGSAEAKDQPNLINLKLFQG